MGYSGVLAVFFLPARAYLSWRVDLLLPAKERTDADAKKTWLAKYELGTSWQDDVRQILALLAPVLSAPVFDAMAKLGK